MVHRSLTDLGATSGVSGAVDSQKQSEALGNTSRSIQTDPTRSSQNVRSKGSEQMCSSRGEVSDYLKSIRLDGVFDSEQIKQMSSNEEEKEWKLDEHSLQCLAKLQKALGHRLTINSGYRSPTHNNSIKVAARHSQHLEGKAFDISFGGVSREKMEKAAREAGFTGIGRHYTTFMHMDTGQKRSW